MLEQDSSLVRSKSYDARFNDIVSDGSDNIVDSEPVYVGNERLINSENSLCGQQFKTAEKEDDNEEQTKIIVTSFAPIPASADTKSRAAFEPSSYLPSPSNNSSEPVLNRYSYLLWPNGRSNLPLIVFNPKVVRKTCWECRKIGETYRLTYKFFHGERKLVKAILDGHGFREVHQNSSEFNIIWSGSNLKSYTFRSLQENQKVNHFPRTCELTRKDRLYKNIQRMQKDKGQKAFSIVPTTFVLPFEIDDFYNAFYKEKGVWIVKPVSLSRGRGIFLINHPDQIPLDDNLVVSKYIANPLLIDGFKFDLRLYVAVTSFDPLVFYLYEEGLTRFATIKYEQNLRNLKNTCMHLTNYSVNKKNDKYVKCNDPDVENYGNKWSISALIKYLNGKGVDTFSMMMNIEEAIIKTLLAVESPLASASRMFVPFRGNCFELFGFDILIDEAYKPWVLEVNLSPSLDCDALIDIKIKSNMIADLLSLTGVYCQNSANFSSRSRTKDRYNSKNENNNNRMRLRPHSANQSTAIGNNSKQGGNKSMMNTTSSDKSFEGLSQTEQSILKICIDEEQRANGWIRLFPRADTWEFYSQYLETRSTGYNMMLHKKIYPRRWMGGSTPKKATQSRAKMLETLYDTYRSARSFSSTTVSTTSGACLEEALERYKRYEQKLNDQVRPNEETLKKLNASPNAQNYFQYKQQQQLKSNFQAFPNGTLNNQGYEDLPSNEPIQGRNNKDRNSKSASVVLNKQLPTINRMASAKTNKPASAKSFTNRNKQIGIDLELNDDYDDDEFDGVESCSDEESSDEKKKDTKDLELEKNLAAKPLDLESVIRLLDSSHYISRIQVRNAFALYLLKIQFRMVAESQAKDDTNLQQMELVTRFLKKAAPNLSQELNIYIPSKRLPLVEQKRMLGKQLADFLHIYRKDTEQMRVTQSSQLETEKKRNRSRLIDEAKFQSLVYNLSESELEHLMSAYMKSVGSEASIFLGVASSSSSSIASVVPRSDAETDVTNEAAFELDATKSSASSTTLESSAVPIDEKKTFYDRKLKRRVLNGARINSSQIRRKMVEDKLINNRVKSFLDPQLSSVPLSRSSRSRSRSRSSVSTTRSNSRVRLNRSSSSKIRRSKPKNSAFTQKSVDYETLMRNIYLTSSGKNKVKSITNINNTSNGKRDSSNNQTSILLPIKSEQNDFNSLQRTPFTSQLIGQKKLDLNATRSSIDLNSTDGDQQQIQLITGLKNLAIKQQERVYSASRNNLKLASSLNLANESIGLSGKDASFDPITIDQRNNLLIQRLEKQKEKTSRLLQKSKAKHTEMILSPLFQSYHFSN